MLISNTIDVEQSIEKVWSFFGDVPQVAACLPGAELTEDLGNDQYGGKVGIRMGPVKLQFDGKASILSRDDANKVMVIDGAGAAEGGRGNAQMQLTAKLQPAPTGTKVNLDMDLNLSGAAAQYGRGMVQDVTKVLMGQFATNMQKRIDAIERGESLDSLGGAAPASGIAIAMQAAKLAISRVLRRFFLPYDAAKV